MRRFVAAAMLVVLTASLCGVARADLHTSATLAFAAPMDLRAAFALRTFGRVPGDAERIAVASLQNDTIHGLSFHSAAANVLVPVLRVPLLARATVALPKIPTIRLAFSRVFDLNDAVARYSDPVPAPSVQSSGLANAPTSGERPSQGLALATPSMQTPVYTQASSDSAFDGTPPAFASRLQDSMTAISTPLRVGSFAISGELERAQFDGMRAHEDRLMTGTTISPRIGNSRIDLSIGSNYERFTTGQSSFPYVANTQSSALGQDAISSLPSGGAAALSQSFNDVTARGVNAGVAVPVARNVTVGMGYGTQRYTGSFNAGFQPALDTSQYLYLGNVTFAIPRTSSAITLSAQQARYQDNLNPSNPAYSETRADLNFTVKF